MGDSLIIKIGAKATEFDNELKKLKSKTANLEKGLASVAKISAAAFAGLSVAVGVAVKKFTQFEKTFSNVVTLLDKSSFATKSLAKGIKGLRNDVLKLGADSGESFEDLNKGLFDLISAGVPAEEATAALADAVDLATAGATNTAVAVKALTSALTAYGDEAGTTTDISQKFFTAQKFGVTTVGELAKGFNKVAGTAKTLKIGFNEILAASTALTANGAKPTKEAFTEMNAVLNSVILAQGKLKNESKEVQEALSLQNIEQKGIVVALNELQVATGGNVVTIQKLLGSSEALSAVLSLTGQQAGTYQKILKELNDEQGRAVAFNEALATKQATTDKSLARLSRSFEAITIQIGEQFAPTINKIADGLSALAQRFNELTDEQKASIANFLKASVVIAGVITGVATFGLAIFKVVRFIRVLRKVLLAGRVAAALFSGALTFGLGTVLAFLPEIFEGIQAILGLLEEKEPPNSLVAINSELAKQKKLLEENKKIAEATARDPNTVVEIQLIQKKIAELEKLRKKQIELSSQQETGSLLLRPESDGSDPFSGLDEELTGRKPVTIPLAPVEDLELEREKKKQAEIKEVVDQATKDKIEAAKNANEILKAEALGESEETIGFIRRRNELELAENRAKDEKNLELRAIELENIGLQKEALLDQEREFQENRAVEIQLAREKEDELNLALQELEVENRNTFNDQELEDLRSQILTKNEIEKQNNLNKAKVEIERRNKFLKDEIEHGTAVATVNQAIGSKEVQGAGKVAGSLVALQNSKNKTLKAIGKKAAQLSIIIDTAKGAVSAYTSLVGIPFIGPALGIAAAAAVIAFGGERLAQVQSAQRGGIVPNGLGGGGTRDRVPMFLEPDELVVPKGLAPDFIQAVGRPDAQNGDDESGGSAVVEISIEDEATDFITAKQRENDSLAIGIGAA